MISESQFDAQDAERAAKEAQVRVAQAQVTRADAALQTARVQLRYTQVTADWTNGDKDRIVAERFVTEGQTVAAGEGLISIVELDPLIAVIYVTEKDYPYPQGGPIRATRSRCLSGKSFSGPHQAYRAGVPGRFSPSPCGAQRRKPRASFKTRHVYPRRGRSGRVGGLYPRAGGRHHYPSRPNGSVPAFPHR
ncbi:MAG: hypothetical protein R3C68_13230 [Myxococcota bacterium]